MFVYVFTSVWGVWLLLSMGLCSVKWTTTSLCKWLPPWFEPLEGFVFWHVLWNCYYLCRCLFMHMVVSGIFGLFLNFSYEPDFVVFTIFRCLSMSCYTVVDILVVGSCMWQLFGLFLILVTFLTCHIHNFQVPHVR